jgi:hypothetical protein
MNPLDPQDQNRRSQYLQTLATLDGRNDPSHPQHGTFTGLYLARIRQLIARDMELLLDHRSQLAECHPAHTGNKVPTPRSVNWWQSTDG